MLYTPHPYRREEECGFCQGNDAKNKDDEPETMVSCEECGRSGESDPSVCHLTRDVNILPPGHPSCMELGEVSDVVRSYAWRCIECKICEICQEKGDDVRFMIHLTSPVLNTPHRNVFYFANSATEVCCFSSLSHCCTYMLCSIRVAYGLSATSTRRIAAWKVALSIVSTPRTRSY